MFIENGIRFINLQGAYFELDKATPSKGNLDHLGMDYGKKHEGLEEIVEIASKSKMKDVTAIRPFGISSQKIENFLWEKADGVFSNWEKLGKLYLDYIANKRHPSFFLEEKEVIEVLAEIRTLIETAFKTASTESNIIPNIEKFYSWLEERGEKNELIMIRSSGDEDSTQIGKEQSVKTSSAGAHKSFLSEPFPEEAIYKLGLVIASYFSLDSLRKRIVTRANPFTDALKLGVTCQNYVGEVIGGTDKPHEIPKSLVIFTNEPNYVATDSNDCSFRIMKISCCYGHGEGVVGDRGINPDNILIYQSKKDPKDIRIYYEKRVKRERLVPSKDKEGRMILSKAKNPLELTNKRILDEEIIGRLFELGLFIEEYRGMATDIELVVIGNEIYPVQIRDVNRKIALPDFVDISELPPGHEVYYAEVILQGLSSAKKLSIRSPQEVLIAPNLEEAEKLFKHGIHKLVIVQKKEETFNSHPIVVFSEFRVTCLYFQNIEKIEALLKEIAKEKNVFQCCPTQGLLFLWDENLGSVTKFIKEGYITHPAPIVISLSNIPPFRLKTPNKTIPADLQRLF